MNPEEIRARRTDTSTRVAVIVLLLASVGFASWTEWKRNVAEKVYGETVADVRDLPRQLRTQRGQAELLKAASGTVGYLIWVPSSAANCPCSCTTSSFGSSGSAYTSVTVATSASSRNVPVSLRPMPGD